MAKSACKCKLSTLANVLSSQLPRSDVCLLDLSEASCTYLRQCNDAGTGLPDVLVHYRFRIRRRLRTANCLVIEAKLCVESKNALELRKVIEKACEQLARTPSSLAHCEKAIVVPNEIAGRLRHAIKEGKVKPCAKVYKLNNRLIPLYP